MIKRPYRAPKSPHRIQLLHWGFPIWADPSQIPEEFKTEAYRLPDGRLPGDVMDDKVHFCDQCFLRFHRNQDLRRHALSHNINKQFKCEPCNRLFTYQRTLKKHTHKFHADPSFKFIPCTLPHCNTKFTRKSQLTSHLKHIHTPPLPNHP